MKRRRAIGPSVSFFAFQDIITAVVGIFILITIILILELTQRVEAASKPATANVDEIMATIDLLKSETSRLQDEYSERVKAVSEFTNLNEFNRSYEIEKLSSRIQAESEQIATLEQQLEEMNQRIQQERARATKLLTESSDLEEERDRVSQLNRESLERDQAIARLQKADGLIYRDSTDDGRSLCLATLDATGITVQDAESRQVHNFHSNRWFSDFADWFDQVNLRSRHVLVLLRPSGVKDFERVKELLKKRGCVYGFDVVPEDFQVTLGFQWEIGP